MFLEISQNSACNFIKKETLAQVFSCELSEISKNNFFYRTPLKDCFLNMFWMHRCMHFQLTTPCLAFTILEYRILYQQDRRSKETVPYVGYQQYLDAVVQRCSVKNMFLEISQNSQESTCVRDSFLIKLQVAPERLL